MMNNIALRRSPISIWLTTSIKRISLSRSDNTMLTIQRNHSVKYRTYQKNAHGGTVKTSHYAKLWNIRSRFTDPLDMLNQHTELPVLPERDRVFRPDEADQKDAGQLFRGGVGQDIITPKGIVDLKDLPNNDKPEVAFIGRSNVGKSSLIKSIFGGNPDLKVPVSKTPGRTRTLKFYTISKHLSLVDMPGYGHNMPEYYVDSMEPYLKTRNQIRQIFLLIDGDVGLQSYDEVAVEMLQEFSQPYTIVLTKIDKNSPSVVMRNLMELRRKHPQNSDICLPQPLLVSAHLDWGIALLQSYIAYVCGAKTIKSTKT